MYWMETCISLAMASFNISNNFLDTKTFHLLLQFYFGMFKRLAKTCVNPKKMGNWGVHVHVIRLAHRGMARFSRGFPTSLLRLLFRPSQ
jgi:hypothetical protein